MRFAFFSAIFAVVILPVQNLKLPSGISAGPCNPEVQDCP